MEWGNLPGMLLMQRFAQDVGKEWVEAKPIPRVIKRREKEAIPFQRLQHVLAFVPASRGVAELTVQLVQDGRPQQELPHILVKMGQHLFIQIVGDEAMLASDRQ